MDKLKQIFEMQEGLNSRIGVSLKDLNEEEATKWVLNYTRAMQQELAELIDSVPWKWWAKYQEYDTQNAKVELIDILHFVVSLAQVMGMDADEVFDLYTKMTADNNKTSKINKKVS